MTALYLEKAFSGFPGAPQQALTETKKGQLTLPVTIVGLKDKNISSKDRAQSTVIEAEMNDALKFVFDEVNQAKLKQIKQGDSIIFRITSIASADGMQHNALVINKRDTESIGTFTDTSSSGIEARQNSYVPLWNREMAKKVLAHSTLVGPGQTKEFVYLAKDKGEKTLICTFPGHWRIMRHDFKVR